MALREGIDVGACIDAAAYPRVDLFFVAPDAGALVGRPDADRWSSATRWLVAHGAASETLRGYINSKRDAAKLDMKKQSKHVARRGRIPFQDGSNSRAARTS